MNSKRSQNFTSKESALLVKCVHKYKNIIESKKIDAVSNREKKKVWAKISEEFKKDNKFVYRDMATLKLIYRVFPF